MSSLDRRLTRLEQATADREATSRAARCRQAADTYLSLLHALRPAADVAAGLPPPSRPLARARAAYNALMRAIAEQGDDQPTTVPESAPHEKR